MINHIRQHLCDKALSHLSSRDTVLANRDNNFSNQLSKLTPEQMQFWFNDVAIDHVDALLYAPTHTTAELVETQKQLPPHGILPSGQMLYMSSGSTGNTRVQYYYSWDAWLEFLVGCSRSMLMHGVDSSDTIMTTDVANMQIGYRHVEDSASIVCGAKVVRSGATSWEEKIDLIEKHSVTVLCANVTKLKRLGQLIKHPDQVRSLRLIMQIGEHLTDEDQDLIKKQFNVDTVLNIYGSVEMGQISFNCTAGHRHIHDDLVHINTQGDKTFVSKLISIPLFNMTSSELIKYSYKGQCACGSFLSTVDEFYPRTNAINKKE
jgi:phenylacetate-coenzyme A ligase PaaK-like adenylate-forming protein